MGVFEKIKNSFQLAKKRAHEKKLLEMLQTGDVVWAKMPLSEIKLEEIEKSHRIRPYIVVYKDEEYVYAFKTSSSNFIKCNNYQEYCINKEKYNLEKDTNVDVSNLYKLPISNIRCKYYKLELKDLYNIQKRIQIQRNVKQNIEYDIADRYYFALGDIVEKDGKRYYVEKVENDKLYCYELVKGKNLGIEYKKITINGKRYFVKFDEEVELDKTEELEIVDIASKIEKRIFDEKKSNYIYKLKFVSKASNNSKKKKSVNKNNYKAGTILRFKVGEILYLFHYNGENYGINLKTYKDNPQLIFLSPYRKREIVGDKSMSEVFKIVEYLYYKKVTPHEPVKALYHKLKEVY